MKKYFFPFFVLVLIFTAGCSSKACKVTGVVTLDGTPLEEANVSFVPVADGKGDLASGITDKNGVYQLQTLSGEILQGTTPGEYTVVLRKSFVKWDGKSYYHPPGGGEPVKVTQLIETLPQKYTNSISSPFKVTVAKGSENKFDFNIDSKANK
ncbi:MAG: carboxypeptidase-like regulatory domain-containing protein [Planctomycetaceae bacterium]|nr:carboxypeptidase-like regulatory domain-containing protein [Planctomycetaceae bacterium]